MKRPYVIVGAVIVGLPLTAESAPLPPDVTSYIQRDRQTVACQPKPSEGLTAREIVENFPAIRDNKECADLERERRALMERYKGNKDAVNALTPKVGFV